MAQHLVIGIERDGGPADPHVTSLCLEDGRRIPNLRAISNIRYGVEQYVTDANGRTARVRVVGPCSMCGVDYLRADDEATLRDTLLGLPVCPPSRRAGARATRR